MVTTDKRLDLLFTGYHAALEKGFKKSSIEELVETHFCDSYL